MPEFQSRRFLRAHTQAILDFYQPVARDPAGGFFQNFRDDGSVYDAVNRHLVSSTRFVFNYAQAFRRGYGEHYRDWARAGLDYLEQRHRVAAHGHHAHYGWAHGTKRDDRALAYGQAFVMLAYAHAHIAEVVDGRRQIAQVFDLLEECFYEPAYSAYADERSEDLGALHPYRGQNANMHLCEALLAAFEATGEQAYLDRADSLARRFAGEMARQAGGLIWEHYTTDWALDWQYNQDKPDDLFKPWGFQPGHQAEWAKLLLQLHNHAPDDWFVERAKALFDTAMAKGWDGEHGGIVYGFAPDGAFADANKYFWPHAEAIAAAYRLFAATRDAAYLQWYEKIWRFSWRYLVDHEHGAWFRVVKRDGGKISDKKSPMGKVDYHTLGACWDVLDAMDTMNTTNPQEEHT